MPDVLQKYAPVTAARLRQPEDANWLLFRRTYDGWGYSPLEQITPANVGRLELAWSFATGQVEGHQAPPIVNNGVMFVATPGNQVIAIEAKTGNLLWRYKRPLPEDLTNLHPTSRGVGLYGDKLFFASADAILVALVEDPLLDLLAPDKARLGEQPQMLPAGRRADAQLLRDEQRAYAVFDEIAVALRREVGHGVTQPLKDLQALLVAQGLDEIDVKHKGIMANS